MNTPLPVAGAAAAQRLGLGLLLLLASSACTRTIGDGCTQNVDCSPQGDRYCDLSSVDGYCTVEGCDYNTCPDGALCVRFLTLQRGAAGCSVSETKRRELRLDCPAGDGTCCRPGDGTCCRPGDICVADGKTAYCASETTERRWCMHPCGKDGDCRAGYSCLPTGAGGALPVPYRDDQSVIHEDAAQFCAPSPR